MAKKNFRRNRSNNEVEGNENIIDFITDDKNKKPSEVEDLNKQIETLQDEIKKSKTLNLKLTEIHDPEPELIEEFGLDNYRLDYGDLVPLKISIIKEGGLLNAIKCCVIKDKNYRIDGWRRFRAVWELKNFPPHSNGEYYVELEGVKYPYNPKDYSHIKVTIIDKPKTKIELRALQFTENSGKPSTYLEQCLVIGEFYHQSKEYGQREDISKKFSISVSSLEKFARFYKKIINQPLLLKALRELESKKRLGEFYAKPFQGTISKPILEFIFNEKSKDVFTDKIPDYGPDFQETIQKPDYGPEFKIHYYYNFFKKFKQYCDETWKKDLLFEYFSSLTQKKSDKEKMLHATRFLSEKTHPLTTLESSIKDMKVEEAGELQENLEIVGRTLIDVHNSLNNNQQNSHLMDSFFDYMLSSVSKEELQNILKNFGTKVSQLK